MIESDVITEVMDVLNTRGKFMAKAVKTIGVLTSEAMRWE